MSERRNTAIAAVAVLFLAYGILAARPVPRETVLVPRWIASLDSGDAARFGEPSSVPAAASVPIPFVLGDGFGYVDGNGRFVLNETKTGLVSVSRERWVEFDPNPRTAAIRSPDGGVLAVIDDPGGYPFFLDGRTFVMGDGQNSVAEIDGSGRTLWLFEFPGQITSVDAGAGLFMAGLLDGAVVLVDGQGRQAFLFEPGGSRIPVILGTAVSGDGSRLAIVSGIDRQRFLVLERFGSGPGDYRVVYHEFLGDGFRRPVRVAFVDGDRRAVFEREDGLGVYDSFLRGTRNVAISGGLAALDGTGANGVLFALYRHDGGDSGELVGMRIYGRNPSVVLRAPFRGTDSFLGRIDSDASGVSGSGTRLVVGGGRALIAFDVEGR